MYFSELSFPSNDLQQFEVRFERDENCAWIFGERSKSSIILFICTWTSLSSCMMISNFYQKSIRTLYYDLETFYVFSDL